MNIKDLLKPLGENFTQNAEFIQNIVEKVKLNKNARILDIGTGSGVMSTILAINGYQVITGEPEHANWSDWENSAEKVGVKDLIEFKPLRAENLPFPDNAFDAIFLYTSFHHIAPNHREKALKEILRSLKNHGIAVIIELTEKGVENVKKKYPTHSDAVDPREFSKNLSLDFNLIKGIYLNAYIFKKK